MVLNPIQMGWSWLDKRIPLRLQLLIIEIILSIHSRLQLFSIYFLTDLSLGNQIVVSLLPLPPLLSRITYSPYIKVQVQISEISQKRIWFPGLHKFQMVQTRPFYAFRCFSPKLPTILLKCAGQELPFFSRYPKWDYLFHGIKCYLLRYKRIG